MVEKYFISDFDEQDRIYFIADKGQNVIHVNKHFMEEFQFSEEEIFSKPLKAFLSISSNGASVADWEQFQKFLNSVGTRKDGTKRNYDVLIKPVLDDSGLPFAFEYTIVKPSAPKANIHFDDILLFLNKASRTIPDIFIVVDYHGMINKFIICTPHNDIFSHFMSGQKLESVFGVDTGVKLYECLNSIRKQKKMLTLEFYRQVNKTQKIFEMRLSSYVNNQVAMILRDITKFKASEHEYIKAETSLKTIWDHSSDGMRVIDSCGRIISVNKAFCDLVGMNTEDLIGKPFHCIYYLNSKSDYENTMARIKKFFLNRNFFSFYEGSVKLVNGKEKVLRVDNSLITIPNKTPLFDDEYFMLSIFKDLTDIEKTQEQNLSYNQALEHSGDGILLYDRRKTITYVNSSLTEMLGINREEIINQSINDLLNLQLLNDSASGNIDSFSEKKQIVLKKSNGTKVIVEVLNNHVYGETGGLESGILIIRDISERKKAEEDLQFSEKRLRSVWENSNDSMILSNACGIIVDINTAFCKLTGINSKDIIGQLFFDIMDLEPGRLVEEQKKYINFFKGKKYQKSHSSLKFKTGKEYYLLISHTLLESENHEPLLFTIFRDLTKEKEKEDELRRIEGLAKIGEMSTALSHELKNPMSSLKNYLEILAESENISISERHGVMLMQAEVIRLNMLLKDVLEYARHKENVSILIDVKEMLHRIVELKKTQLDEKLIEVKILVEDAKIHGDYIKILSVFMNLIENAIDAIQDEGIIEINSFTEKGQLKIHIRDSGCGISDPDKVFNPFFSTKSAGTGLGLSIVRKIVHQHNGIIRIVNNNPGQTTFELTFNTNHNE